MLRARAPREREEAPGVAVVLGLPRISPVRGEPRARWRQRERATMFGGALVGFSTRVSFAGVGRGCWCGRGRQCGLGLAYPRELELGGNGGWQRKGKERGVARRRGFWSYL
jgi:hypothetical protein